MSTLTWLHLSDWHQKGSSLDHDRKVVRDALLRDIRERANISSELATVDFVVFSGDLAFSGRIEEYEAAQRELLDPLLDELGLSAKWLFFAPGNHDLDRSVLETLPDSLRKHSITRVELEKWLSDISNFDTLLSPFESYRSFVFGYTGQTSPDYASIRTWICGGKKVALLGVNSAWMCGRHKNEKDEVDDARYMMVSEQQIHDALGEIEDAEVRIIVLHHPFDWLTPADRNLVEARLGRECHFILRGHEHQPQVQVVQGTAGDCVVIPAGASYKRRIAEEPRYTNAYNWVHLDFDTGQGTVYLRRWSDPRTAWICDWDANEGGEYSFPLPKSLKGELPLISDDSVEPSGKIVTLAKLQEWKSIHTEMQSMLDNLGIVVNRLDRCQSREELGNFDRNLRDIEQSWSLCVPRLRAISLTPFTYVDKNPMVKSVQKLVNKIRRISGSIAEATSLKDVRDIEIEIAAIKEEIATTLSVADRQIVKLVEHLMHRAMME